MSIWIKLGIILLLVLGIVGAGWYVQGLRKDNQALRGKVQQAQSQLISLQKLVRQNAQAALQAQQAQARAAKKAAKARARFDKALEKPEAKRWGQQKLPEGVREALQ